MIAFDTAIAFTLGEEGQVSNVKSDHGGLTDFGVTDSSYQCWLKQHGRDPQPVTQITRDEAIQFYQENYWCPCSCDQLPGKIAIALFDWAVNHGDAGAEKLLQHVLGVTEDGQIGQQTIAAANAANVDSVVETYLNDRKAWYIADAKNNPSQAKFLKGWIARVEELRTVLSTANFEQN